jgi:hypothetical protein
MMERHLATRWHCVDHFCRMLEVVHLLRDSQAGFPGGRGGPYRLLLGVEAPKRGGWKRFIVALESASEEERRLIAHRALTCFLND